MVLELWPVACAAALLVLGDLGLIPLEFFGLMRSSDMANDNVKRFRVDLMGKPFEGVECGFYVEWTPDFGSNWGWWEGGGLQFFALFPTHCVAPAKLPHQVKTCHLPANH